MSSPCAPRASLLVKPLGSTDMTRGLSKPACCQRRRFSVCPQLATATGTTSMPYGCLTDAATCFLSVAGENTEGIVSVAP